MRGWGPEGTSATQQETPKASHSHGMGGHTQKHLGTDFTGSAAAVLTLLLMPWAG